MDISGLDKAQVLAALFNAAILRGGRTTTMTERMAGDILSEREKRKGNILAIMTGGHLHFDWLDGRSMKIDLSGDEVDTSSYNRDNGEGAAERAIAGLRRA